MNIRESLFDTVEKIITVCALFFSLVWMLFKIEGVNTPFKESLAVTISLFAALATIGAAYIASKLFNDWREAENHKRGLELGDQLVRELTAIHKLYTQLASQKPNSLIADRKKLAHEINDRFHELITFTSFALTKELIKNNNIKALFELLMEVRVMHRNYRTKLNKEPKSFQFIDEIAKNNNDFLSLSLDKILTSNLESIGIVPNK